MRRARRVIRRRGRARGTRRFTAKQIAAQRLFAQRARAGTLKRKRRRPVTRLREHGDRDYIDLDTGKIYRPGDPKPPGRVEIID